MHQLQLIGIKTNLESFVTTTLMEHMLNRHQLHLFLWVSKQWGINTGGAVRTSTLPIPFTNVFLAVASTSSEWCCPGCSATNTTVTTRAYQSNRPDVAQPNDVNWIIIGCQPQWRNNPGLWAIPFTEFVAGGITMTRTGSQSSGTWYGDSGTISLTGYTALCATNESWVSSISGSAIAVGL